MNLTIQISEESAALLAKQAEAHGLSVEAWVEELAREQAKPRHVQAETPVLPVWHLGTVGTLRRADIYDDAS